MPHEVYFNKKLGVIEVRTYGDVSLVDIGAVLTEIERLIGETGVNLVLNDAREQIGNAVSLDISGVVNQIVQGLRVAILVGSDQITADNMSIVESLVRSRRCLTKRFVEREDALLWLGRKLK